LPIQRITIEFKKARNTLQAAAARNISDKSTWCSLPFLDRMSELWFNTQKKSFSEKARFNNNPPKKADL
jgi:hypothetical protein